MFSQEILSLFFCTSFYITRLNAATQEAETVRREQTVYEKKVGELQARCATLEEEKYAALSKVRESVQTAEEATLQKEQVKSILSRAWQIEIVLNLAYDLLSRRGIHLKHCQCLFLFPSSFLLMWMRLTTLLANL